ncbi:hypothetical protein [Nocardioides lianchengensis]|uniref:PknH-like extracellular domain-containing protein n=1 Tax=Nocardioides lianchengensis TaxID=1045774 RepID=A0A1G6XB36_9ACTN|nr:hypothetical protein [Nocardioides lianchengensis]NYG09029.1 hypothetical protein [Nocardioides lianchengensis]SDD75368.1 hypothetical protein SAMN05421872_110230 [Nocardioides lianchengensis]
MKRLNQVAVLVLVAVLSAACGGSGDSGDARGNGDQSAASTSPSIAASSTVEDVAVEPSTSAEPEYRRLSKKTLEDTLLSVNELPAGYARDPSGDGPDDDEDNDSYCAFEASKQPDVKVRHDYLKGGGLSSSLLSFSIGQYDSEKGPQAYLDEFAKQLETCTSEESDGETVKYAVMSVPQIGDRAMGVRVEGESYTLAADMATAGPVLIVVGGGGLIDLNVDEVNELFAKQVEKYLAAAKR